MRALATSILLAGLLIAIGLVTIGLSLRYEVKAEVDLDSVVHRIDRWTGDVTTCLNEVKYKDGRSYQLSRCTQLIWHE